MDRLKTLVAQLKLRLERLRVRYPVVDVTLLTFKGFSDDDGGSYSAALTYYTFFSIFPIMLFAASILGFLTGGNEELRDDVLQAGVDAVPLLKDILAPAGLKFIEERAGSFAVTGVILALYSGTGAIVALQHALNRFYGVTDEPGWMQKRVRALRFLAVFGVGVLLSVALGGLAGFATNVFSPEERLGGRVINLERTGDDDGTPSATIQVGDEDAVTVVEGGTFGDGYTLDGVRSECATVSFEGDRNTLCVTGGAGLTTAAVVGWILGHIVGFLVGVLIFASAYKFLPALKRSWRDVLPGALLAAAAFEILKELGTWYLERGSAGREATFGAFALAAGFLVASYLIAQVTLLCAEVNDVLMSRRLTRQTYLIDPEEAPDGNDDTTN